MTAAILQLHRIRGSAIKNRKREWHASSKRSLQAQDRYPVPGPPVKGSGR